MDVQDNIQDNVQDIIFWITVSCSMVIILLSHDHPSQPLSHNFLSCVDYV